MELLSFLASRKLGKEFHIGRLFHACRRFKICSNIRPPISPPPYTDIKYSFSHQSKHTGERIKEQRQQHTGIEPPESETVRRFHHSLSIYKLFLNIQFTFIYLFIEAGRFFIVC